MESGVNHLGPVVHIWAGDKLGNWVLKNVALRKLGDRNFVVGTITNADDPRAVAPLWIPVEEVVMLSEFPSVDVYLEVERKCAEWNQPQDSSQAKRWGWFG